MYSDKTNILQLTTLLRAHGINELVLCPGSRNAPLIQTLTASKLYRCYAITDERSAGFFAIGRIVESKKPVAVCCTSGSAALNLHPAVAEAFYRQLPLIVITADRPRAWIGQMDGQTLPQEDLYGKLVKMSVALPEVHSNDDEWLCNRLINEALLACKQQGFAPVHINVPIAEPLFQFTTDELPQSRSISRLEGMDSTLKQLIASSRKLMLIRGQEELHFANEQQLECKMPDALLLCEHIGNCRTRLAGRIDNFDSVLYALSPEEHAQLAPDILISYGGHITSKRLKNFIRNHPPKHHIHLSPEGKIVDTYACQTLAVATELGEFFNQMEGVQIDNADYVKRWQELSSRVKAKAQEASLPYSQMAAVGSIMQALPSEAVLHIANSSSIRYAELFELPHQQQVYCNKGTNGIEGSLSAMMGYAAASDEMNVLLIGDLSFFYDMNGLWHKYLKANMRIVLLNNGGGEIFKSLPGLDLHGQTESFVTAAHACSAACWAKERGFDYQQATNQDELARVCSELLRPEAEKPQLLEVFTDMDSDIRILKNYYKALKTRF